MCSRWCGSHVRLSICAFVRVFLACIPANASNRIGGHTGSQCIQSALDVDPHTYVQARGKVLDNTVSESQTCGLSAMSGAQVQASSNTIQGLTEAVAIMVVGEGTHVTLRQHEVQGVSNGLVVAEGAEVDFIDGRIFHVTGEAVLARGKGSLLSLSQSEVDCPCESVCLPACLVSKAACSRSRGPRSPACVSSD